jgi:RNA polymerase subunit RPABC4/transcription elongation factor Spt4
MADNECVFCGDVIPEGRQVCPNCEAKYDPKEFFSAEISSIPESFVADMAASLEADVKNYFENHKKRKAYCVTKILMHIAAEVEYFRRRIPDAELSIQMTHGLYMLLAAAHQAIVITPAGDTLYGLKIKEVRAPGLRYWISVYEEGFTSQDYQEVWV